MACCICDKKSKQPIPLKKIEVQVNINGFLASVEPILHFENGGDEQLEAVFRFPIDDSSSVYKFEADIDGRKVVAECQEKKQAKEHYDEAIQSGHTATLLEEEDLVSDIFVCKIGNLLPKKSATVKFSYVTEIAIEADGNLKYTLPTLLNPRYNPSTEKGGLQTKPPLSTIPANDQPYEFNINISICGLNIVSVISKKDSLSLSKENEKTLVTLKNKFTADHDFEIEISLNEPFNPFAVLEKGVDNQEGILKQDVVMLNFFPQLKEENLSDYHEFLFVIDRSGSMDGSRIESAKKSLLLFLKSLPQNCYFNIIGFGTNYELLFKEGSAKYTKKSLDKALKHQKTMKADLGGTEILEPLIHIYSKPFLLTHSRNIFLITDGGVFNTKTVINLVQKHSQDTRVFTLGIGEGASTALIKGVARAGKGKAEFVNSEDKMALVVINMLKCAMQPTFTDVKIDWKLNGLKDYVQIPKVIPPNFNHNRLIVYVLAKNFVGGSAVLSGKIGEKFHEFPVSLDNLVHENENFDLPIHRMAAKSEILRLQDTDEKESNKSEIILLSLASNVISKYTSLVGIDKDKNEIVVDDMITRIIPTTHDPTVRMKGFGSPKTSFNIANLRFWRFPNFRLCSRKKTTFNLPAKCTVSEKHFDNFIEIVSLQSFDGNWVIGKEMCNLMKLDEKKLISKSPIKNKDIWATVIVLTFFKIKFAERKDEWEMIELKALNWLSKQNLEGKTEADLFNHAEEFFNNK